MSRAVRGAMLRRSDSQSSGWRWWEADDPPAHTHTPCHTQPMHISCLWLLHRTAALPTHSKQRPHPPGSVASSHPTHRAGGRTAHRHTTSPPFTSPHARPLVSARHAARSPKPSSPAARSLSACQSTYHGCYPRHCCTSTVVSRARRSRCSVEGAGSKGLLLLSHLAPAHSMEAEGRALVHELNRLFIADPAIDEVALVPSTGACRPETPTRVCLANSGAMRGPPLAVTCQCAAACGTGDSDSHVGAVSPPAPSRACGHTS